MVCAGFIDPGKERYYDLEKQASFCFYSFPDCQRWTLVTKSNNGHSTLTVSNKLFSIHTTAEIVDLYDGNTLEGTLGMMSIYGEQIETAKRKGVKDSPTCW